MACEHDLIERESAVHDGACPICSAAEIERLRSALGLLRSVAYEAALFKGYNTGPVCTPAFDMALRKATAALNLKQ